MADEQRVVTDAQTDDDVQLRSGFVQQLRLRNRVAHCLLRGGNADGTAVNVPHLAADAFYLNAVPAQNGVNLPPLLVERIAKRQSQLVKAALLGKAHGLCQTALAVVRAAECGFLRHQPIERLVILLQPGIHLFSLSGAALRKGLRLVHPGSAAFALTCGTKQHKYNLPVRRDGAHQFL